MIARALPRGSLVRTLALGCACLSAAGPAAALDAAGWKYRQEFELRESGIVKLLLPVETLDRARPALPDLRVIGPAGQEVPFAIEIELPPEPLRRAPRGFRVQLEKLSTRLTIETGVDAPLTAIELATPAHDFVKAARVEISPDGERWEPAGEGFPLTRDRGVNATTLPLDHVAAAFVRITIDDWRTLPVTFTGATLTLAQSEARPAMPLESTMLDREEFARETVLTLDLQARHVPLASIEFAVRDPWFSRAVTIEHRILQDGESVARPIARGSISRARLPNTTREHLRVPLHHAPPARELQVRIANDSNAPLAIEQVRVFRRPVWLVLHAPAPGAYALLTGHPEIAAPVYDLEAFAPDFRRLPEVPVAIGRAQPNPAFRATDSLSDTPLLGAALDVTQWKFRKTVTPSAAGVQELELDVDVLARAQPGLADLRLLREGRQAPYLLERTALHRAIRLTPVPADDPAQPHISRWQLDLPRAAVPVTRFTLRSSTPLFSRPVQVFEQVTNRRGETSRRHLAGSREWNSTPDRRTPQFAIELTNTPTTDRLHLEIDNGDNPPIALTGVEAEHRVVRLLFRTDAQPLQLYYGFDGAGAPRYDLALVAQRLLDAERNPAKLGVEESGEGDASGRALLSRLRGGVLLWSALGLVVIILLVVIARLLPGPPDSES